MGLGPLNNARHLTDLGSCFMCSGVVPPHCLLYGTLSLANGAVLTTTTDANLQCNTTVCLVESGAMMRICNAILPCVCLESGASRVGADPSSRLFEWKTGGLG